jgi:probable phosphoglycerate mutase
MYYLYFDGGSRGNSKNNPNARAGYGYVIYDSSNNNIADGYQFLGAKTNNYAEYSGLINGLQHAHSLGITTITVRGDSNIVIKQMTGQFAVNNPDMKILNGIAKEIASNFTNILYEHVYRENNKEADMLSNIAMDNPKPETECENLLKKAHLSQDDVVILIKKKKIGNK